MIEDFAEILITSYIKSGKSVSKTAYELGISESKLRRKLKEYGEFQSGISKNNKWSSCDYTGYRQPTPQERDDWYNKDWY